MQYSSSHSNWANAPASSSWRQQVGGNASANFGVPWTNVDNSYSRPSVHYSADDRYFPPPPGQHSDTMTHNINLSITMDSNMSSKPDGLGLVRYRAPDIESFIFDHVKGYRFDPTTGLHYDADSRCFMNYELGIWLSWDPLSNTYRRAGDLETSRPTGKVLPWDARDTAGPFRNSPAFYSRVSSTHEHTVETNPKTYSIFEGTSRTQSNSSPRQIYDSEMIRFGRTRRSRSRSASSSEQPRRWRSRSRSVGRREQIRHRRKDDDSRINYYRMSKGHSRSPRPLCKTERLRSRSRSASSRKPSKSWRSRSVERRPERQRYRSNSRDARRNASKMVQCCSHSPRPYCKTERQRRRSRSASSSKLSRRWRSRSMERRGERHRYRSNSRDARRNASQMVRCRPNSSRPHCKTERQWSRSRSPSSSKLSGSWRSRSVERRGERQRFRSNSRDTRRNASQTVQCCSHSPRRHCKTERQRRRSRSPSSSKLSGSWRSRSVERGGEKLRYRSNSRDAIRNASQMVQCCPQSPRPHKEEQQRSKGQSASSDKQPRTRQSGSKSVENVESKGTKQHRSNSKDARKDDSQTIKGCPQSEIPCQKMLSRTSKNSTHDDEEWQDMESSQSQEIEMKKAVWNRLGPSIKKENVGSRGQRNSESEIPTSVARTVRVVCTYDTQKDRSQNCDMDPSLALLSADDELLLFEDEIVSDSSFEIESSGTKHSEREIHTSMAARTVRLVHTRDSEKSRSQNCFQDLALISADVDFVVDEKSPDTIKNGLVHDGEAPVDTDTKPAQKQLRAKAYSTFVAQPANQRSRCEPASNKKSLSIQGSKRRDAHSDDYYHKLKPKSEYAAESCGSKKEIKEEVISVERPQKNVSPKTGTRRIDVSALRSSSNSPARQCKDSGRVYLDRSGCGFLRSSKNSRDGSNVTVTGVRNQSKTSIQEARSSRSREPSSDHSGRNQRTGHPSFESQPEDQRNRDKLASNQKTTPIGGSITNKPRSEYKMKLKMENADKLHCSKKKPIEVEVSSVDDIHKQNRRPETKTRRVDESVLLRKSNTIRKKEGHSLDTGRSRYRSSRSSERSEDRSRIRRSVSTERNQSRQYTKEVRRSRSRSRTYHFRASRLSDSRGLRRRSPSTGYITKYDWERQICDFRESRGRSRSRERGRGASRERRRSCSVVTSWNHTDSSSSLSLSSSDHEFVSRSSRESKLRYEREIDKKIIYRPPRHVENRSSTIYQMDANSDRIKHNMSHRGGTMEESDVRNIHYPSPKRRKLVSREDSPLNSHEGEGSVDVGRSGTKRQDSTSVSLEFKNLDTKTAPDNRIPEQREKTPSEMPAVVVINKPTSACEDHVLKEGNRSNANLSDEAPAASGKISEEAPKVVGIDKCFSQNGAPEPTEYPSEENPTVVLIHKPESEDHKPRKETLEVVVIDQPLPEREALQPRIDQASASLNHKSTNLVTKTMPENGTLVQIEKTHDEMLAVIMNKPAPACEDSAKREDNPEGTHIEVATDKPLSEEPVEVVVIDNCLTANEGKSDSQKPHDSSPTRRRSESRGDSPSNSLLEGERVIDIWKSCTNSINSQEAASISRKPTTLGKIPEAKRAHEPTEKCHYTTPAVVVTNKPRTDCEDSAQREDNAECTPKVVVDTVLLEDKTPSVRCAEEDPDVLFVGTPLPANESHEPTGKITAETPKLVLTHEPLPETSASKPREESSEEAPVIIDETLAQHEAFEPAEENPEVSEVAFIEIKDEPTEETPKEPPEVIIIDNGDVLGHLFANDDNAPTNIVLVAPLPHHNHSKDARDDLKTQIGQPKDLLKVYISYENTSDSPCRFMVVSFKTMYAAKQWCDSLRGTIVLNGEDGSKMKAYLHFLKKGNWNCINCKSFNFFMQSLCSKCYQPKGSGFSPVAVSKEPTPWVGIARLESSFSTTREVIESLPPLHTFNILNVEILRERSGLSTGLCVFEVESKEEGSRLHNVFLQQERNVIYVVVKEKPKTPDEEYLSLLFDKTTPTNVILVAVIPLSDLSDIRIELSAMKTHLLMLLKEDGVRYRKITFHVAKNVGAPYSYVLITFADAKAAALWFKSRRKMFGGLIEQNQSSHQPSTPAFNISLHFSKDNWRCRGCSVRNFPLRSLCHRCFKHRDPNKVGAISQSFYPARWVAIPVMSSWSKTDECIVSEFRELLKEFILKRVEVVRDSECPSLPLACAIEMQGKGESLRLREHLTKQGRFSVFVFFHKEMDERALTDLSNIPDVVIVEAPPPECIDLTNEANHPPTTEITNLTEVITPDLEVRPPERIDLTSEVNCSQRMEEVDASCSPESATPDVEPSSVNPPSEADVSRSTETASPEIQPIASTDVTNEMTEATEQAPQITTCSPYLTQSDVISVAPVPRLGGNTQWHCAVAFLNYGAEYESVQYCQGNLFGVSYNYCLVHFSSPASAQEWYNKCQGSIKITNKSFPTNSKRKRPSRAYLHFSQENWRCDCGKENCHVRSICFNCFTQKGEKIPIFRSSLTPTKYLAVKLFKKYAPTELAAIFPKNRCMMHDVLNIKFICDPKVQKDNFGIYVLETKFLVGAVALRNYYKKSLVVQSTSYVALKDHTAGTVIDLGLTPVACPGRVDNGGNTGLYGAVSDKPKPDYAAIIWTSLYGFHLDKPPSNIVIISLCLEHRELPVETRDQIQDSLKEAGVTSESIINSFKGDVGSPFSYCSVSFDSVDAAQKWFDKCKDTFQFEICCPDDQKLPRSFQNCFSVKNTSDETSYFIKAKLHYSQSNWLCNCGTSNFPLRSVCHACFKNKNKDSGYSVSDATKFVGIKLTECLETVDISALYDVRNCRFNVSKINIGLDPAIPRDPFGIVIFEMESLNEGIKFRRFLADLTDGLKCGQQSNNPIINKFMKILSNSSGITYLIPYQKCQINEHALSSNQSLACTGTPC